MGVALIVGSVTELAGNVKRQFEEAPESDGSVSASRARWHPESSIGRMGRGLGVRSFEVLSEQVYAAGAEGEDCDGEGHVAE